MKKLILILMLLSSLSFAQVELSRRNPNAGSEPAFYLDYTSNKSQQPDKTKFDVFLQMPYRSIQFVKKDSLFRGGYSVTLTFYDEDKSNILLEKFWQEEVSASAFSQTNSPNNYNISYKSFDLRPGKYVLKCYVEDADSKKTAEKTIPVVVREMQDSLSISDILFVSGILKKGDSENIVPNVGRLITNKSKDLSLSYEIYSSKPRDVYVNYLLIENDDNKIFDQTDQLTLKQGINPIYYTIKNQNFVIGKYNVEVDLQDSDKEVVASVKKDIYSRIFGMPSTIIDLDKAIEQMTYIASSSQVDEIKDSKTYQEKLDKFIAFWNSKKPNKNSDENPIMNEYYRRIDYANKNFKGIGEGWRTDMGMIYVTFGPPSNVERHSFEMDSKPYEIWEYYDQNRYFVFVDRTGFGDYYLVNPDYSRWPGYRQ